MTSEVVIPNQGSVNLPNLINATNHLSSIWIDELNHRLSYVGWLTPGTLILVNSIKYSKNHTMTSEVMIPNQGSVNLRNWINATNPLSSICIHDLDHRLSYEGWHTRGTLILVNSIKYSKNQPMTSEVMIANQGSVNLRNWINATNPLSSILIDDLDHRLSYVGWQTPGTLIFVNSN